jgi:hypothetical protein
MHWEGDAMELMVMRKKPPLAYLPHKKCIILRSREKMVGIPQILVIRPVFFIIDARQKPYGR